MVDGAAYYLLCHDDVALFPDAVHLLVEEAFRSNAGIVSPKVVSWDDPERLVHVGMTVDKGGSVVERVQPHEIDHGQHDAVRDVFVAPGGAPWSGPTCSTSSAASTRPSWPWARTSTCAGGPRWSGPGSSWPPTPGCATSRSWPAAAGRSSRSLEGSEQEDSDARPAHPSHPPGAAAPPRAPGRLQVLRAVPPPPGGAPDPPAGRGRGRGGRAGRQPGPGPGRACGPGGGTSPGSRRPGGQRTELQGPPPLGDKEIRLLQVGGSARLSAYVRRVFQHGFHGAHADELAAADAAGGRGRRRPMADRRTDSAGRRAGVRSRRRRHRPGAASRPGAAHRSGSIAALLVVIGPGRPHRPSPRRRPVHPVPGLVVHVLPVLRRLAPVRCGDHRSGRAGPRSGSGLVGTVLLGGDGPDPEGADLRLPPPRGLGRGRGCCGRSDPSGPPWWPGWPTWPCPALQRPRPRAVGRPGRLRRGTLGPGPPVPVHRGRCPTFDGRGRPDRAARRTVRHCRRGHARRRLAAWTRAASAASGACWPWVCSRRCWSRSCRPPPSWWCWRRWPSCSPRSLLPGRIGHAPGAAAGPRVDVVAVVICLPWVIGVLSAGRGAVVGLRRARPRPRGGRRGGRCCASPSAPSAARR